MPTTNFTLERDGLRVQYDVTYTLTSLGKLDEVRQITLTAMFVVVAGKGYQVFRWAFPAELQGGFQIDMWANHIDEIREQIEGEIEGAREADGERRRKDRDDG